jgi:glycosyltransferase involved in cell wall biosynthesis
MKVVIDGRRLDDFGIGTYIRNLVQSLAQIDQQNQYVVVRSGHSFQDLPPNFEVVNDSNSDSDLADQLAFPMLVRRCKADLCHIPLNRVPLLMRRPYVVTIHDMSSLLFNEKKGLGPSVRRYRFRRGLVRANRVIAVSAATRRDVENLMGVPSERIRLVHNAPNPEFFHHAPAEANGTEAARREQILERYQIQHPFLLYAGSIRPQKNVPRLVEAFAVARAQLDSEEFKDLRLVIIGDELSAFPSVRRAVIQSRVEGWVRFLGFVPFETLRIFYEAATAFVFPSLYEGFGLPPLEAMASGTPVITSSSSSLPEVVGEAAMLVNPENVFDIARGIKELLLNPELRAKLSAAGRVHAAKFSWERAAREVLEVYREVSASAHHSKSAS